ncbi:MAG: hypothetical protein HKN85_01045 [Gammaproteobacteria bacterium]|nr:hypothetical protein [Gammaproteobacteria bacterium]
MDDPTKEYRITILLTAGLLFGAFTLVYIFSTPSLKNQDWDSLEYAHAAEIAPVSELWGNHPLGHLVHSGVYRLAIALGYSGRALPLLQLSNGVLFAVSLSVFFLVLVRRWYHGALVAAGWTVFLGSGIAIMSSAGSADIYALSLLLMLLAWDGMLVTIQHHSYSRLTWAAVSTGLAGLAHQFGFILLAAATISAIGYLRWKIWLTCLFGSLTVLFIGYSAMAYLETGTVSLENWLNWAGGYLGEPTFGKPVTSQTSRIMWNAGSQSVFASDVPAGMNVFRFFLLAFTGLLLFRATLSPRPDAIQKNVPDLRTNFFPIAIGIVLITWWDPGIQGKFWLLIFPFFAAFLSAGLPDRPWSQSLPLLIGLSLLAYNQFGAVRKNYDPDPAFDEALKTWVAKTEREDVLFEGGQLTHFLHYWSDRPGAISAHLLLYDNDDPDDPFANLHRVMRAAWARGSTVWIAPGISDYYSDERLSSVGISVAELERLLHSFYWEGPVFEYRLTKRGPLQQVFRLLPRSSAAPPM